MSTAGSALRPTILLFDLDGTLVSTDGAGRRAIVRAFARRHGCDEACVDFGFGGMTDRAIARAGLKAIGVEPTEAEIAALLDDYLAHLDQELLAAKKFRVLPGVEAAIEQGAARPSVALGLGTGNLRLGAQKKLEHAGLWHRFTFGGFADDSEDRAELLHVAAVRGAERLHVSLSRCRVVVIGDTSRDVVAAQANEFEVLAVASGFTPLEELRASKPNLAVATLAEPEAIAALFGAARGGV